MILLVRVDSEKKMARWYAIAVQPTLLDGCAVVCFWGSRRSRYQCQHVIPTVSLQDSQALAEQIVARKIRKGYLRLDKLFC